MVYNFVGLRTAEDAENGGAIYPIIGELNSTYLVEMEPADGNQIQHLRAEGLAVSQIAPGANARETISRLSDLDIDIYITDARVIIACEKYDKGGGWRGFSAGGLVTAAAANAVSHARAARRRRGKMLVGHVRYPWLVSVGATVKSGLGTHNGVRLIVNEKTQAGTRKVLLDLRLDKRADAPALARQIAQLCAAYRLSHDIAPGSQFHEAFLAARQAPRQAPEPKKYAMHQMPMAWHVAAASAYPQRADESSA